MKKAAGKSPGGAGKRVQSAGILVFRRTAGGILFFLVHPGGPLWAKRDKGAWSLPKGEYAPDEDPLAAAKREFLEETGFGVDGDFIALEPVRNKSGKLIRAWMVESDLPDEPVHSNYFEMEWPPRSGKKAKFLEVDRGEWFDEKTVLEKINPSQAPLIREALSKIKS